MKLYIKQKVFSIGDSYNILDENGNAVFFVKSELFTLAAKLHLNDAAGNELYYIKKKITLFLSKYEIYQGNSLCAVISQKMTFMKSRMMVDSNTGSYEIEGDFLSMNYIIKKMECCLEVSARNFSLGETAMNWTFQIRRMLPLSVQWSLR